MKARETDGVKWKEPILFIVRENYVNMNVVVRTGGQTQHANRQGNNFRTDSRHNVQAPSFEGVTGDK